MSGGPLWKGRSSGLHWGIRGYWLKGFTTDDSDPEESPEENLQGIASNLGEYANISGDIWVEFKNVGWRFLKFDNDTVELQHDSIRDFIMAEEGIRQKQTVWCLDYVKRFKQTIAPEAAPKCASFHLLETIFRKFDSPSFQEMYILIPEFEISKEIVNFPYSEDGQGTFYEKFQLTRRKDIR